MKCPICNSENPLDAGSCHNCGFGLLGSQPSAQAVHMMESVQPSEADILSVAPQPGQAAGSRAQPIPISDQPAEGELDQTAAEFRPVHEETGVLRATPSESDRIVGAINIAFGGFLILAHAVIPILGRLASGVALTNQFVEPVLIVLAVAILIVFAGFDKWTGRDIGRFKPIDDRLPHHQARHDLGAMVFRLLLWLALKALPYVVAVGGPLYVLFLILV